MKKREREGKRERKEAHREIAKDEVGKDEIRRIASQPTHLVLNFFAANSGEFKDCQSRLCATQSLPH